MPAKRNPRNYRERCATDTRKAIQQARFWLDYDRGERPGNLEVAIRHAHDAVGLAEKFRDAVEKEARRS